MERGNSSQTVAMKAGDMSQTILINVLGGTIVPLQIFDKGFKAFLALAETAKMTELLPIAIPRLEVVSSRTMSYTSKRSARSLPATHNDG